MNLKALRYFVQLAELKHFGQAAEACCVSQPTLSMQLKKLENTLCVALFLRTNKAVVLTDAGRILLPSAKEVLKAYENLQQTAMSLKDAVK